MDWTLFHILNRLPAGHPGVAEGLAGFTAWSAPALAVATLCLWLIGRPGSPTALRWRRVAVSALGSAGIAVLINQVISHLWARPRPTTAHPLDAHLYVVGASTDPSFPSDHAAAAFAIAFAVLIVSRPAGLGFVVAAAAISLDRIILGLHYPGDVAAGILVAGAAALAVHAFLDAPVDGITSLVSRVTDPLLRLLWNPRARRAGLPPP